MTICTIDVHSRDVVGGMIRSMMMMMMLMIMMM